MMMMMFSALADHGGSQDPNLNPSELEGGEAEGGDPSLEDQGASQGLAVEGVDQGEEGGEAKQDASEQIVS